MFVRRSNQDNDTLHRIDPDGGNPTLLLTADINNVRTNGTTSYHVGASALYFRSGASLHTAGLDGSGLVEFVPEADVGGFPSLTRPRRHPCVVVGHGRGRARHLAPDQVARD